MVDSDGGDHPSLTDFDLLPILILFFPVELVNGVMDIEWEATYVPQNSFVLASNEKNTSSLESTTDFRPLISLRFSKL